MSSFVAFDTWADRLAHIKHLQEARDYYAQNGFPSARENYQNLIKDELNACHKLNKILFYFSQNESNPLRVQNMFLNHYYVKRHIVYAKFLLDKYLSKVSDIVAHIEQNKLKNKQIIKELKNKIDKKSFEYLEIEELLPEEEQLNYLESEVDNYSPIFYKFQNKINKKSKSKYFITENSVANATTKCAQAIVQYVRDEHLSLKLRYLISIFRDIRLGLISIKNKIVKNFIYYIYRENVDEMVPFMEYASHQMDAHGEDNLSQVEAGNVTLTEARQESVAVTEQQSFNWLPLVSSDVVSNYSVMTDRWLKFSEFTWDKNLPQNRIIINSVLPKDIVVNSLYKAFNMPNTLPFRVHRYWKGDMEIKIQLNSNKFQIGQLQCAWWYQTDLDEQFKMRKNIWSASQTEHVLISAGSSNEATLIIPFKYHLPLLSTSATSTNTNPLNLGRLIIFVLNPLTVSTGGPSEAYGSIFCRFINSSFTGQFSGELADFQMDRIITGALSGAMQSMCPNMDNIQDTRNSQYVVPIAAHSWAYGTGISEPLQALRLDPSGITSHPENNSSESSINYVTSKYGLLKTIEWRVQGDKGDLLFDCDASPILDVSSYSKATKTSSMDLNQYYMPPVSVVSSMFNYWRGNIKFRFDIIASQFHTGRLVVGYVPGAAKTTPVTLQTILAGPHIVFTLQEDQQFTYEIPYIADRPFWSRKYTGNFALDQVLAPSRIYMFILNPLIRMESIADKVYINIYIAGSNSFEVSIPVQPSIGCGWNAHVLYPSHALINCSNATSYYAGVWHSFLDSKSLMMRATPSSDSIALFPNTYLSQAKCDAAGNYSTHYYEILDITKAPIAFDGKSMVPVQFSILIWVTNKEDGRAIMIPMKNSSNAKSAAANYIRYSSTEYIRLLTIQTDQTTSNTYSLGNPYWVAKAISGTLRNLQDSDEEYEILANAQGEREQDSNVVLATTTLDTTVFGKMFYGESFSDLKDITRRYQTYTVFKIDPKLSKQIGQAAVIIPLLPQGLALNLGTPNNIVEFTNRCREGHIPLILSGYRYYRGSIRIRIVMPTTKDLICWVQHRPDRKIVNLQPIICDKVDSANCIANHLYASFIQDCGVNSILQFEIPFYKNSAYNLLQTPIISANDEAFYYSLGDLAVGAMYAKPDKNALDNYNIVVYYSLADDFHMSTFQGFPPMISLDDIADQNDNVAVHQMGLSDYIRGNILKGVKEEASVMVTEHVATTTEKIENKLKEFKDYISTTSYSDILNTSLFRTIASQIAHVFANFNFKSVAIAIATIIVEIGLTTLNIAETLISNLIKLMTCMRDYMTSKNTSGPQPNQPECAEEAIPQMDIQSEQDQATIGIITVLWTAVCSVFSVCAKPLNSFNNWKDMLIKDIPNCLKSGNVVFVFLRNILSVMDAMKKRVIGFISPRYKVICKLDDSYAELKAWMKEVLDLDDPWKFEKERYLQKYKSRVHVAFITGRLLYNNLTDEKDHQVSKCIMDLYKRIRDLREKMLEFGDDSFVRLEPFCIWQYGGAGLGKSTITHDIVVELLKSRQEVYNVPPIYNHSSASDFWDSCQGNPAMVIDDIFNVQEGEILQKHLQLLFMLISPVVLTPPKARLEDKGKSYNPKIVICNSNYDFPKFNNVHADAIYRRRDLLVKFEPSETKIPGCPHCNGKPLKDTGAKWLKDYHHLQFRVAKNPRDPKEGYGDAMDYAKYKEFIIDKYQQVMDKNEDMYRDKVKSIMECMDTNPFDVDEATNISDLCRKYINDQTKKCQEIARESVFGEIRAALSACGVLSKSVYTKMSLGILRCMAHAKGMAPKLSLDPKVALNLESGNTVTTDDFTLFDEACAQNEDATFVRKFNYNEVDGLYKVPVFYEQYFNERDYAYFKAYAIQTGESLQNCAKMHRLGALGPSNLFNDVLTWVQIGDAFRDTDVCRGFKFQRLLSDMRTLFSRYPSTNHIIFNVRSKQCEVYDENLPACIHWTADPIDVSYDKKKKCFMYKNIQFDACCQLPKVAPGNTKDRVDCPWDSFCYKYLWFKEFLFYNPEMEYFKNMSHHVDSIPEELKPKRSLADIDLVGYKKYIHKLKNLALEVAYGVCKISRRVWEWIIWLKDLLVQFAPIIIPLGLAVSFTGATLYLENKALEQMGANGTWSTFNTGMPQSPSYSQTKPQHNLNAKVPTATQQSEIPQFNVAIQRVMRNTFRITAMYDDKMLRCEGVVIKDRQLLVLRHYLEEFQCLPPYTKYYGKFSLRHDYENKGHGVEIKIWDLEKIYYNKTSKDGSYASNFVIINLPINIEACKSLVPFLATQRDHELCTGDGVLVQNNGIVHQNVNIVQENTRPITIRATDNVSKVVLQTFYSYRLQSRGMCGSVLLARNLERPIIGIHVAGVETGNVRGLAEPLMKDTFSEVDKVLPKAFEEAIVPVLTDSEFSRINIDTFIYPLGCVDSSVANHHIGKSSIIPSKIQGVFPVRTEPAPLSRTDTRLPPNSKPLEDGISHKGKPPGVFNKKDLEEAAQDLLDLYKVNVLPIRGKVGLINYQDVVCGNNAIKGFEALEWSTSPGYPLRFQKVNNQQTGKKWLFHLEEQEGKNLVLKGFHPLLKQQLTIEKSMRERGIKPFTVFIDCLKDSCLPSEKCRVKGKTRIFSVAPVQFTIEFKRYFLDFTASFQNARLNAEHGIGIDVNSLEWTDLVGKLFNKGTKFVCGDYKNYGPGLMLEAAKYAFQIILDWYAFHGDEENNKVRKIMMYEILNAYYLAENLIYTTPCGIPSGSPITTPLNSIVGSLYIRLAWKYTTNLSYAVMKDKTTIVTYGDDVIIAVDDEYVDIFNTETMSIFFSNYNITFTDADKTGEIVKFRDIHSASFLKCKFSQHPFRYGVWVAQLDKVSVEGCANWINKKNNIDLATIQNCEQTLELAHGHGKEYYNYVKDKLIKAMQEWKLTFRTETWEDIDQRRYGTALMPVFQMEQQREIPRYQNWTAICDEWAKDDWYDVTQLLDVCNQLKRLNFSLQEHREVGFQTLNMLLEQNDIVSRTRRFPAGNYIASHLSGLSNHLNSLRMALTYKNGVTESNNHRSSYNDSLTSYYKILANIRTMLMSESVVNRNRFEDRFNLIWNE